MLEVSGSGHGVRVEIGVVNYEVFTQQCGRSVVQILVVRMDIGVMTYKDECPTNTLKLKQFAF